MLKDTLSMSERLACKAVGLARATYRRLPAAQTPADPDAEMRAWLRAYATKHPCHGFRRAWAALRYDERREVNKKKIHRLWREEGLQVKTRSPRKRPGVSFGPADRGRRAESGVGDRLPVRLHHRRQGHQDRLDDRRTHP
jgi:putative transposase